MKCKAKRCKLKLKNIIPDCIDCKDVKFEITDLNDKVLKEKKAKIIKKEK